MNRIIAIIFLFATCTHAAWTQDRDFSSIDDVIEGYYEAVGMSTKDARSKAFEALFTETGTISSVITTPSGPSRVKVSNWREVVEESSRFYMQFSLSLAEQQRTADYYLDHAVVHTIVKQSSLNMGSKKTYYQNLWIEFDLVYFKNRWWVQAVSWIDQDQYLPIENAIVTDTLWHQRN